MSFSIGIVGLPNVGKSTLFNALTKCRAEASNYPFCTIDPNVGIVKVPDERLEQLARVSQSAQIIPTVVEFVDIAGLVKNAHQGEGLGNQFLSHIRETDAICEVVRVFEDNNVVHVDGQVNPASDIETIKLELIFADLATLDKRLNVLAKESASKSQDKELKKKVEIMQKVKTALENSQMANTLNLDKKEKDLIKEFNLLTIKPILYALNVSEEQLKNKNYINPLPDETVVAICAKTEAELADLNDEEKQEYLKELNLEASGLNQLIAAAYQKLNLITFFTSGPKETRAWTVENGAKAPETAGRIHTDFEKGFIRADVINWQDLVKTGTEAKAKEQGLLRTEGKNYVTQDGDVMVFKFSN
ncbi:MAG: redox-regulated ATPase YchF [bacterium]